MASHISQQLAQPPLRKTPMIHVALVFVVSMAAAFAQGEPYSTVAAVVIEIFSVFSTSTVEYG
jgi:hypothetical protein